jgi:hypothetical protein
MSLLFSPIIVDSNVKKLVIFKVYRAHYNQHKCCQADVLSPKWVDPNCQSQSWISKVCDDTNNIKDLLYLNLWTHNVKHLTSQEGNM